MNIHSSCFLEMYTLSTSFSYASCLMGLFDLLVLFDLLTLLVLLVLLALLVLLGLFGLLTLHGPLTLPCLPLLFDDPITLLELHCLYCLLVLLSLLTRFGRLFLVSFDLLEDFNLQNSESSISCPPSI